MPVDLSTSSGPVSGAESVPASGGGPGRRPSAYLTFSLPAWASEMMLAAAPVSSSQLPVDGSTVPPEVRVIVIPGASPAGWPSISATGFFPMNGLCASVGAGRAELAVPFVPSLTSVKRSNDAYVSATCRCGVGMPGSVVRVALNTGAVLRS